MAKWDSRNFEIRSKSVEQTLIPLVTQITTLVNHKERSNRSEKARQAIRQVGEVVKNAVMKFVTVGEQISRENEDVAVEMQEACEEARKAGDVISRLTSSTPTPSTDDGISYEKTGMVRAARALLSAVTRVLIIADSVMIKRLLVAVKKVDDRLKELETINSFTEFVQSFSQFGAEMVELAHLSGDRQNDLKDDCLRAEMCCARSILEKSTMMLLTTSKTCLRHPGSMAAKGNRNGVFLKMREAMTTIRSVTEDKCKADKRNEECLAMDLKKFENALETFKKSQPGDSEAKMNFEKSLETVLLDIQPVINAPHTRKEKREKIIALCENAQDIMKDIIEEHSDNEVPATPSSSADSLDLALQRIFKTASDLRHEVHQVATDQVFETFSHQGHRKSLPAVRSAAAMGDLNQVEHMANIFTQDAKRLEDVSKVARNMTTNEAMAITAKKVEENISSLCPQVVDAARTLAAHPVSKIAQENMEVFIDIWETQVEELGKVLRGITAGADLSKNQQDEEEEKGDKEKMEKDIPDPSKESRIDRILKKRWEWKTDSAGGCAYQEKAMNDKDHVKLGSLISNVNLVTSQLELHQLGETNIDIVNRAMDISRIISNLHLFTKGEGDLFNTDDFFEAAQNLADCGKALYKVARQYASKTKKCPAQRELLTHVDRLPTYCQQLMFTSRSLAVGQAACYRKVWGVLHLTKSIIKIVARVVNRCYLIAEKNSLLKFPPDQRLWQIDESLFSEESSLASCSTRTSRKSSTQSLPEISVTEFLKNNEYEPKTTLECGNGPVYKTEL